jgi:deoxycytidine triphosphate deaminase
MLQNAFQVEELLQTNNKGSRAQVGYDLTLKSIKKVSGGVVMQDKTTIADYTEVTPSVNNDGKFIFKLEPGTYSLTFEQGCKLPNNMTAFIRHRSSILRCGAIIKSGVFDPGFEVDEMGSIMIVTESMIVEKSARVAQIIMFENNEAELYNGQWQKDRDVK